MKNYVILTEGGTLAALKKPESNAVWLSDIKITSLKSIWGGDVFSTVIRQNMVADGMPIAIKSVTECSATLQFGPLELILDITNLDSSLVKEHVIKVFEKLTDIIVRPVNIDNDED